MLFYGGMYSWVGEFMEEFNKEIESDEWVVEKLVLLMKRIKVDKGMIVNEWDLRNILDMWKKGMLS